MRHAIAAMLAAALGLCTGAARADIYVVVNAANPVQAMTRKEALNLFMGRTRAFTTADFAAPFDLRSDARSRTIDVPVEQVEATLVHWRQTFDTAEHDREIVAVISVANEQDPERLAAEVQRGGRS